MEWLIALLCLCSIFSPSLLGVGITLLAERQIGRWAYALGWLLPVIVLATCYGGYDAALRLIPCEPAQSLACGEPLASAFLLLVGMICITMIANALAQGAVYLFLTGRRQARQQAYSPYEGTEAGYNPQAAADYGSMESPAMYPSPMDPSGMTGMGTEPTPYEE